MAKKGEKLSDKTRNKLSKALKGREFSEDHRKKLSLASTKNRKCSIDGCNKTHEALGFCKNHYMKHKRDTDPKWKDKQNKRQLVGYYTHHEERKKRKRILGKLGRIELYKKLGGKCESCGEKLNESLSRVNLQFHHKTYDEDDERIRKKFKGNLGSKHHWEIKRMLDNGISTKKKFALLCIQCNLLEAFVRMNKSKAFDTFCWLYGEGYFDETLKDDPKLKKITEFIKK